MSAIVLAFSGVEHLDLKRHLFPGDGREAAAIVLCKDAGFARNRLLAHTIFLIPHDECQRASDRLTWPGEWLSRAIDVAEAESLSIILTHSHPGGLFEFSAIDDESDRMVVPTIFAGWSGQQPPLGHGSAIMTPCGGMRARLYDEKHRSTEVSQVAIIGDDIRFDFPDEQSGSNMAFGASQTALLSRLHAVIMGASGTGSVIAEQVVRLGFSEVTLIDFDRVESKNLNRILNSTQADANARAASARERRFMARRLSFRRRPLDHCFFFSFFPALGARA
ncbi:MAG: ThiF family adenylyltransferase, partial [Hyphomonadaceae bacterium]